MSFEVPDSPKHPEANEEIRQFPTGKLQLDLNPGVDDSDSDEVSDEDMEDVSVDVLRQTHVGTGGALSQLNQRAQQETKEYMEAKEVRRSEQTKEDEDDVSDENIFPSITPTFDNAYESTAADFKSHITMSRSQQSSFVNYLDNELLQVQRRFIKTQSGELDLAIDEIIEPLYTHLKVIWLSISPKFPNNVEYFIKILADLEDYLDYFKFPESSNKLVFEFLQFLDVKLSFLYDKKVCNSTQYVRILSIVNRLRLLVIDKFSSRSSSVVEMEVSKLFEGILERA